MKIFGKVCFWITVTVLVFLLGMGVLEIVKFLWAADPSFVGGLFAGAVVGVGTIYHLNQDD